MYVEILSASVPLDRVNLMLLPLLGAQTVYYKLTMNSTLMIFPARGR